MAAEPPLLEVAGTIYEAVLQPDVWPVALSQLGGLIRGTSWTLLGAFGPDLDSRFIAQNAGSDPARLERFHQHYTNVANNPSIPLLLARGSGIRRREEDISDHDFFRHQIYRELLQPADVYHSLSICILTGNRQVALGGTGRPERFGAYTDQELRLLRQLAPHLQRATQMLLRLGELESRKAAHEALLDRLACGVILLDRHGRLLWGNRAAMTILAAGDGLSIRRQGLAAARPAEHAALQALIRGAASTSEGRGLAAGGALSLSRPSRSRPLAVLVSPIRAWLDFARRPAVAVFASDPELEPEPAPDRLRRLYGLTRRQAALAALLMQGADVHDAAERLGISLHTARTHLRIIFDKTGTRRQSELVSLLLRGPAGVCQDA